MRMRYSIGSVAIVLVLISAVITGVAQQQPGGVPPVGGRGQGTAPVAGQQPAAARGATAPPPINWPSPPLPPGPIDLETGIQRQIRLFVTKGLNQPWSMAFLPDGAILVTERPGRLRIIRNGVLDPTPIAGLPQVQANGLAGLMDLALHPRFNENKFSISPITSPLLLRCTRCSARLRRPPGRGGRGGGTAGTITLARAVWNGTALTEVRDIFSAVPSGNASRIVFGRDGMIYMTVGVGDPPGAAQAQDPNSLAGKVLRLRDDGTVPTDNPFVGRTGYRPEIFTMGHRNALGLYRQSRHRRNLGMRKRSERRR